MKIHGGLAGPGIIDFSSNINPLAPPGFIIKLIRDCDYSTYPNYAYPDLVSSIAKFNGVKDYEVVPVNGASEGLYASIMAAKLTGFSECIIVSPNYGDLEFEEYCRLIGFKVKHHLMPHDESSYILGDIKASRDDVVMLSNPNNPTGSLYSRVELLDIANEAGLLIVDEAYINLSDDPSMSLMGSGHSNVVVVRSLTKELGLPGLRIGYVYSPNERLMGVIRTILPSWNVNSCAAKIAEATHSEYANVYISFLERSRAEISELRKILTSGLTDAGFRVYNSRVNFVLAEAPTSAERLYRELLNRGITIRLPRGFIGLGDRHVRVAVRGINDVQRLIREIKGIMAGV